MQVLKFDQSVPRQECLLFEQEGKWVRKPSILFTTFTIITKMLFLFFFAATEKDFLEAINKVIKAYAKFSATPRYMTYN